jgi:hypothetical protein
VKIAITGFANSGKTTIFNALTGLNLETTIYPTLASSKPEPHIGVVKVPDKRLDRLSSVYKKTKTVYATVEYTDYIGITSTSSGGDASQNAKVFNLIKDADAIMHVVRAFENDSVIHPLAEIDPVRDIKAFEIELILEDLELVERRLERIELATKRGERHDGLEKELLLRCKKALEDEVSLRNIAFSNDEKKIISSFQFLSLRPEIIVVNIGERDINSERTRDILQGIDEYLRKIRQDNIPPVIALCGKIEMEIAQLPEDEAGAFLRDFGIEEAAMKKLCRISYESLGLISFFTIGKDEVKAWTIKKGTEALKAAGKVHSDMEKGFIRAEVISFDDFVSSGEDMVKAREKGLVRLEGKNYIVKDGDIINFKFNI